MNKAELITKIAEKSGMTKRDVETMVAAMTEIITERVAEHEKVHLSGFGVFEAKKRAARIGRNPGTKEPIEIPERYVAAFRPGKNLAEAMTK